ncbi:MAG: hypothetical protein R2991_06475 [Thermoanaerobaculia bacterium]
MRHSRIALSCAAVAATVLVGCQGGGHSASPTDPAGSSMQSVMTAEGAVMVSHSSTLMPADQEAIAREVADGYRRALTQLAQVSSVTTNSFMVTTAGVSSTQNGYYLPDEHRIGVRPDWRALDHELQHHFCYMLRPPGVDCSVVDHCEGTDLTGTPMSVVSSQCG